MTINNFTKQLACLDLAFEIIEIIQKDALIQYTDVLLTPIKAINNHTLHHNIFNNIIEVHKKNLKKVHIMNAKAYSIRQITMNSSNFAWRFIS